MNKSGITISRDELKQKLPAIILPLLKRDGIKAIRMDDIASSVSISKRTLYECYANKEDLLYECVKYDMKQQRAAMIDYINNAEDEMDVIVYFIRMKMRDLDIVSNAYIADMGKYPKVLDFLRKWHDDQRNQSRIFLKRCTDNGFFVKDFNYDIIQDFCDTALGFVVERRMDQKHSMQEIFRNFGLIMLRGCCTEKGLKYLNKYLKQM